MNANFKVIGLTRLEIKPKSTAREADALTTRPSELLSLSSQELLSLHYTFSYFRIPPFPSFPISVFQQDALITFPSFSEISSDSFRQFLFLYFIKISAISAFPSFSCIFDIFAF